MFNDDRNPSVTQGHKRMVDSRTPSEAPNDNGVSHEKLLD